MQGKKALFPYGYDKGGELMRYFGIRGIPHSVLLDASGTVIWRGHPASLRDEVVESALAGALTHPVYDWPESASPVRQALAQGQYAQAIEAAGKLTGEEGARISEALRVMVQGRLSVVRRAFEAGDYLGAYTLGKRSESILVGLDEGKELKEMLAKIDADPKAKAIMKGQEQLARLTLEQAAVRNKRAAQDIINRLKDLQEAYPDSIVWRDSQAAIEKMQAAMRKLR